MNTLADTLHNLLKNNIVLFTFRKKDGTIRKAKGTRNLVLASSALGYNVRVPKGEEQPNSYYDIDKDGWRSYIPSNVISIDCVVPFSAEIFGNKPKTEEPKPVKEIPVQRGIAVELPPTFGKGTTEKIREEIEKLGKDIEIPVGGGFGGGMPIFGGGLSGGKMPIAPTPTPTQMGGGKVSKPMDTGYGFALPISGVRGGEMGIEDFAKIVAKYVVAELIDRLTK